MVRFKSGANIAHCYYSGTGCKKSLHGKTVVLTGGNAGIGAETAKDLVNRGAEVFILCRDQVKVQTTNPKQIPTNVSTQNIFDCHKIYPCFSMLTGSKNNKLDPQH